MAHSLEIHIHDESHQTPGVPHRYFYSGIDDVSWTCDPTQALKWLQEDIKRLNTARAEELGLFEKYQQSQHEGISNAH